MEFVYLNINLFILYVNKCYVCYHIEDTRRHYLGRATIRSSIRSVPSKLLEKTFYFSYWLTSGKNYPSDTS